MASPSLYQSVPFGNVYPPGNSSANGTVGSVSLYGGYQVITPSTANGLIQYFSNQDNVQFFLTANSQQIYAHTAAVPPIYGVGAPDNSIGTTDQFYIDTDTDFLYWKDPTILAWVIVGTGAQNVSPNSIPQIKIPVTQTANNQAFQNPLLSLYKSNRTQLSAFRNGVFVESRDLVLLDNTIYFNIFLTAGDELDIIATSNSSTSGSTGSSYGNANVASFLPTYSDATYGTAAQLGIDGNIYGNGLFLNKLYVSTILDPAGNPFNFNVGSYGNANVANYLPVFGGNIGNGNGYIFGNGSQLTGLPATYSNANVANYLPINTSNVSAGYYFGNGAFLTGLPSQYSNANVANYLPTYTGDLLPDNLFTNNLRYSNGNPYSFLTLTQVSAFLPTYTGNLAGGNLLISNNAIVTGNLQVLGNLTYTQVNTLALTDKNIFLANGATTSAQADGGGLVLRGSNANIFYTAVDNRWNLNVGLNATTVNATGNISGNYIFANGAFLTGLPQAYSNANVANYLPTYTGSLSPSSLLTDNLLHANGAAWLATDFANAYTRANLTQDLPNNTSNVSANYFLGNGALLTGVVGNYGNSNVASFLLTNTGNISANYYTGNGRFLTGLPSQYSNANVANFLLTNTGNIQAGFYIGNGRVLTGLYGSQEVIQLLSSGAVSNIILGGGTQFIRSAAYQYANGANALYSNVDAAGFLASYTGTLTAGAAIIATNLSAGNIFTGNANVTSNVKTGNILANGFFYGNGAPINLSGNYSNANVAAFLPTYTGQITASQVTSSGIVYASQFAYGSNGNPINEYSNLRVQQYVLPGSTVTNVSTTGNIRINNVFSNYYNPDGTPFLVNGNIGSNGFFTPYIDFSSSIVSGNNQVFSNALLNSYANGNQIALFKNGSYVSKAQYVLSGTTLTFNANLVVGDSLEIITLAAAPGNYQVGNSYSNANVASYMPLYLPTYGGNLASLGGNVITVANVQASYFIGNGSQLTGITLAYGNANVANYLPVYGGNILANTVTAITLLTNANITAQGNIQASYFLGNGQLLTGTYSNTNVSNYLPVANAALSLARASEYVYLTTAQTGNYNFDILTNGGIQYAQGDAIASAVLNLRGNATTTFNSLTSVGQSVTITYVVDSDVFDPSYTVTGFRIDGTLQTVRYVGGLVPSAQANNTSAYTYTVIKTTVAPTYRVLGSQTRYS